MTSCPFTKESRRRRKILGSVLHDIDEDTISWSRISFSYWLNQWITWAESKTTYRFRLKLMGTHVSGGCNCTVFVAVIRYSRFANRMQKVKSAFASPFETWKFQNRPSLPSCLQNGFLPSRNGSTTSPRTSNFTLFCYLSEPYVQLIHHHSVYPKGAVQTTSLSHLVSSRSHHAKSISTRWCSTPLERS